MRSGLTGLILALVLAGPAAAAETVTTIPGAPGPGPSKYDKVFVTKFGPESAKRVLVLMPGFYGGAGDFTLDAREIVKRVPGLQVWALDRRSQALEDTGPFADALAGRISVQQAFDYYLGWLVEPRDHAALPAARSGAVRVRQAVGPVAHAAGRAPRGAQREAPGQARDPRRALAGRLDDRRLRELGLQRPTGLQGRRRPRPCRRRAVRLLLDPRPRGDEEGGQGARHERAVRRPPRPQPPVGGRRVQRGRRAGRPEGPDRARHRAVLPAAAGAVQAADPGHQPRPRSATRSTPRPRPPRSRSSMSRPARSAPTATGSTARSRRSSAWRRPSGRSPPTRASGTSRPSSASTSTRPTPSRATRRPTT